MIKLILCLFFLIPTFSEASEFMLSGGMSYNYSNIFGQNDVPSYKGSGYFGEIEYLMPFSNQNALSIFGTYHRSSQENTANDEVSELLKVGYMGGGLKLYFGSFSVSASIGKVAFENSVSGTIKKKISSSEIGQEVGIAYRLKLSQLTGIIISAHALHSALNPENGSGFYEKYELWQYRASIGLNIIIPSNPVIK